MNLLRLATSAIFCLLLSNSSFADTLNANQTGNISTQDRNGGTFLTVNWWDGDPNVGLIQFDLSAYAGMAVGSATLNLYHQYNDGQGALFNLYQNTSAWNSSISSWSSLPTHSASPVAQLSISDSSENLWRMLDVTAAVNAWTSGSLANYGFTLERVDQGNPYIYFSASSGPTLDITAAVPEPETYAMLLAGLGLLSAVARRKTKV